MSTMVIDGKPATARSGKTVEIRDPATGELVDNVPQAGVDETRQAIDAAHVAFRGWADTLPQKRAQILMKGAALARQHLDEVASLLTREQGKPLRDSKIEAERFVENIEFYATLAASGAIRGKHVQLSVPGAFGLVVRRPLGVVGAIIPWNFPLTLLANKIAPALAVGNTVVAKPASTTPLSTIRLVELMNEGGLPPGVLNVVVGPGAVVGQELIENLTARAKKLKVAPGSDASSQMGPMHTAGGRETIEAQLKDAVDRGGRVLAGGKRLRGEPFDSGFFFEPTIITDVPLEARVWREETFGPLLPIARVKDLDEALERANDSEFGLGSSIFTRDLKKAQIGIDRLDAGYTWVNTIQIAYDELPFGGTKHSGFGKEHGVEVLDFYTEQKSAVVAGV